MMAVDGWQRVLMAALALALGGSVLADELSRTLEGLKALVKAGKYAQAESGARALLTEMEQVGGADSVETAHVLDVLVESLLRGGKVREPETLKLSERAVAIKERALGPDHPDVAASLYNLGIVLHERSEYAPARAVHERALAIREKALGPEHIDVAKSLNGLGLVFWRTGDHAAARPFYERSRTILEKTQDPYLATVLNNLGGLLRDMGDYAAARGLQERVVAIYENTLGPDHPLFANSLGNLGLLVEEMGDYAAARLLYERALAIQEKALGPDHPAVARSLSFLGELLNNMGDYAAARPLYERALAIREKALGPDHEFVAADLRKLGNFLQTTGDYAAARPLYERALAIQEKALGPDHPAVARSLNSLASLLHDTGDYAAARPLYGRSLAILEKAPPTIQAVVGLHQLARLLNDTGDYAGAKPLVVRALAASEKWLVPDHPDVAQLLVTLAEVLRQAGDLPGALAAALRAEEIGREHLRLTARALPERQSLGYASVRASGLDVALSLQNGLQDPESRRLIFDAAIRSRAVVLDEMASRHHAIGTTGDSDLALCAEKLVSTSTRYANLVVRGPDAEHPEWYRGLLYQARQEKEQAEQALADKSVAFAGVQAKSRIGLDEVADALSTGNALVAFVRYRRKVDSAPKSVVTPTREVAAEQAGMTGALAASTPSSRRAERTQNVPSYLAFVLRAGEHDPQVVDLGSAERIDGVVARWKEEASNVALREGTYRETGTALRAKVWDPVAAALGDAERIFVVPDGSLNLVNLGALPLDDGGYLIEHGPLVHYLSAERDLVPEGDTRHGDSLVALGEPNYDATSLFDSLLKGGSETAPASPSKGEPPVHIASSATYRGQRSACGEFASARFEPLPATGKETREIVRLWEKYAQNEGSPHAEILDLRGAGASETAFKRSAPGRRVLHLATHGFFLGGACESALTSERGIGGLAEAPSAARTDESPPPVTGENPLLLSGLALAGANHRSAANEGEDDGILTAEEIASLDLSGVEWAVLSACDTGVGEVRAGEGVFGLRRALQVAGAGTLIMSLWSVDDESTRAWMKALYEGRLERKLDTAEAVREASLTVLSQRRKTGRSTHPLFWAAFVAAGDWR